MSPRRARVPALALLLALACAARSPATQPPASDPPKVAAPPAADPSPPVPAGPPRLFRNARVMTAAGQILERADLLVVDGRISAVGPNLSAPAGAVLVDVAGKTLTPGIIDTHSHLGVYASPGLSGHADGNEMSAPNTAHVRAGDAYWPQDPQIDLARAGGVTTAQILPGSANLFGGRTFTVRLIPGARSAEDARFPGAPEGLKMACGENPKRVYGDKSGPKTRMGNVAGYRDAFQRAKEYNRTWSKYHKDHAAWEKNKDKPPPAPPGGGPGKPPDEPQPPARDFGLETLSLVLDGEILVHNHCYRADEMAIMLDLATEFGFKVAAFHHGVEAYKVADLLAARGVCGALWADWWGFKMEAYDGIQENLALVDRPANGCAIVHSDSSEGIQRLNQEAAKAMARGVRAGLAIAPERAIRWVTANPARALGIADRTGTLEAGKLGDVVVWNRDPFSVYALADQVYVEGALVYDRAHPAAKPRSDFLLGQPGQEVQP